MNARELARRLEAWQEGKPLPRTKTLAVPRLPASDVLFAAFVRMGGEVMPWGIGWRQPGGPTRTLAVAEPRDRTALVQALIEVGPALLSHFGHPRYADPGHARSMPQLWVPDPTHVELLHAVALSYTFTRLETEEAAPLLRALGRLCGWLFRESLRPGQLAVVASTSVLRELFTFPADDVRQAHLGFLLAWLLTQGGREARLDAAQRAEREAVATAMDPAFERDPLQPMVSRYHKARRDGQEEDASRIADRIRESIAGELVRRLDLVERAFRVVREDPRPVNPAVGDLVEEARRQVHGEYLGIERRMLEEGEASVRVPSPETDRNPATAAWRFLMHESYESRRLTSLMLHDRELFEDALAEGEALEGEIVEVGDEGEGRKTRPFWRVRSAGALPLRFRSGDRLMVVSEPKRIARVREIVDGEGGVRDVTLEIVEGKTRRTAGVAFAASDGQYVGRRVGLVGEIMHPFDEWRARAVFDSDGPGAWLTHATAGRSRGLRPS